MPEGHTVHRIARDHTATFAGQKLIVTSPQGRFSEEANQLSGRKLVAVEAHGKHLFYHWSKRRGAGSDGNLVHIHFGLYGKFRLHKNPAPEPRGAVRVRMIGSQKTFDLNGPTRCEILSAEDEQKLRQRLGQDPLRLDADPAMAWDRIHRSRAAIGTLLLDQSIIAGLGNIYRAEILHLLKIHPARTGSSLSRDQYDQIWKLSVKLLKIGVKYNRIITVDPAATPKSPGRLNREERLLIYKKAHCGRCNKKVEQSMLGARKIYYCDTCQM